MGAGGGEVAGVDAALAEAEQGGGLFLDEPVPLGLGEQLGVLAGGVLGSAGGEGALGLDEAQAQVGAEVGGAAGGQFLEVDAEAAGDVPQRVVGGAHAAGLQGGDVGGGVGGLGQLPLGEALVHAQLLHAAADDARFVPLGHVPLPNSQ